MAAVISGMDELVREYLLYRGFSGTIKQLDNEIKNEKEKAFRVDKLMEQLHVHITVSDLAGLRDYWSLLDRRLFSRLDQVYATSVNKLETSVLKLYVINAVQMSRHDKVEEFFQKMTPWEQSQPEWKEWFMLPFIKNAEEHSTFAMYFTKQWQDTLLLSLHNFLSVVIAAMPKPTILRCEEDSKKLSLLKERNSHLVAELQKVKPSSAELSDTVTGENSDRHAYPSTGCMDLMDDFFVISQDTTIEVTPPVPVGKTQKIRSIIRNITQPSSPIMGKRGPTSEETRTPSAAAASADDKNSQLNAAVLSKKKASPAATSDVQKPSNSQLRLSADQPRLQADLSRLSSDQSRPPTDVTQVSSEQVLPQVHSNSSSSVSSHLSSQTQSQTRNDSQPARMRRKSGEEQGSNQKMTLAADKFSPSHFLLLSQEEYNEHRASLAHCRFSSNAHCVATADVEGVVKIWNLQPSPVTIATTMSKSFLQSLEWISSSERLILLGSKTGTVRLYDVKEKKAVKEVTTDSSQPRIVSLACSPSGNHFVCSGAGRLRATTGSSTDQTTSRMGKLTLWDVKTMKLERLLNFGSKSVAVNSTCYNHNGNLIITGGADGAIRLFDVNSGESVSSWQAHSGDVYSVLFSPDETGCYSMGADGKFIQWSLHRPGQIVHDLPIHPGACGPFVMTGAGGYRQVQTPKGRLFAFDTDGKHVLTAGQSGGFIYQLNTESGIRPVLELGGHRSPVVSVDWSAPLDCKMCLTGSMEGTVKVSTLLQQ